MVISIICLLGCVIYAFIAKFTDEPCGKYGGIVLRAALSSIIFFVGKFIGVAIYYMIGPSRVVTILLRNLPGVLAYVIFVISIRNSNNFNLSRKDFILSAVIMSAIIFIEDIFLMLLYRMFAIILLG